MERTRSSVNFVQNDGGDDFLPGTGNLFGWKQLNFWLKRSPINGDPLFLLLR